MIIIIIEIIIVNDNYDNKCNKNDNNDKRSPLPKAREKLQVILIL